MRITIAKKLWLGFAILILILGVSGSISYFQIEKLNRTLTQYVSVHGPLENALFEMEINIGETALSILAFVRDGDRDHIKNLHRFQNSFETFLERFNILAITAPEKAFGQEAASFFKEHKALSQKIILLTEARGRKQKAFTELADRMNIIIDQNLSPGSAENGPALSVKRGAAMLMKTSFHRMFSAIESYLIQQKPELKAEIEDAEKTFLRWKNIYANSGLSPAARASLSELEKKYEEIRTAGKDVIDIADQLRTAIGEFETDLLEVRQILDQNIQPLIHQETEKMAEMAIHHGKSALYVSLGMTLFVLAAMGLATWITTRGIIYSVQQLKEGSNTFGRGDLDHRIDTNADDELKDVATAFNEMAAKRKRAEQIVQESADKIKLFSYSISHDLKSPAIGIHGLALLLQKQSENLFDEKSKRTCAQIIKTSALIEELVTHINAFIATRESPLKLEKVPIAGVMETIRDEVSERMKASDIEWSQPEHLPVIKADRLSMIRVIRNLVDNALKYGGDAMSRISFSHEESKTHHIFSVADDGKGLKEEDMDGIFEAFKRKKSARGIQGTGLGLAIVKEIMARHGGDAWAKPGSDKGVTFYLSVSKDL